MRKLPHLPIKAPAPFTERLSSTGCNIGGHIAGGFAKKDITDLVQIVQGTFLGSDNSVGVTMANSSVEGVVIGHQIGCDYEFPSSFVIDIEGAASGSALRGTEVVGLQLGPPGDAALDVLLCARGAPRQREIRIISATHSRECHSIFED